MSEILINRVLEIDALTSREGTQVQLQSKSTRDNKDEIAPENSYNPIMDIMLLQHAIMALVFECEKESVVEKGEIFKTLISTFEEMYTDSSLHESVVTKEIKDDEE